MDELHKLTEELVVPPPVVKAFNYPASVGLVTGTLAVGVLLFLAGKFDPTHGALTISLMIIVTFAGTVTFCLFFTIPQDPTTAAVVGGLVAAVGATVSYWLKPKDRDPP
jgi:uncharacterized membrane protein YfcA